MRELTKSTFSAGLAMSLLGMQTMMNVFRRSPTGGTNPAQEGLDAVTQAMVNQTGGNLRETFQAGDKVQRKLIDMTFQLLTFGVMRPGGGMSTMADTTRQATDRLRMWMGDMGGARGPGCGCMGNTPPPPGAGPASPTSQPWATPPGEGWGPMPNNS